MADIESPCIYFEKPGKANTDKVVKAVAKRLERADLDTVVVASSTGYTALRLSDALDGRATIISVTEPALLREWGFKYPLLDPDNKRELEKRGVIVAEKVPYLFHNSVFEFSKWKVPAPEQILVESLYAFGQGMKVAIEVVFIAVACGFLEPFGDVIGVGGTGRGADTAIVTNATFLNHAFSEDRAKRMKIKEILCKVL